MRYYTSDLHLGHKNVIHYCNRPFRDLDHMHDEIIKRWNRRVRPDDHVFVLGDFAFLKPEVAQPLFDALRGHKHLIMGNHDEDYKCDLIEGWESVQYLLHLSDQCHDGGRKLALCHYPVEIWRDAHRGRIHLHGHSHGNLPIRDNQRLDVGTDCWDYTPVTLDEILARLAPYPDRKKYDHH